VPARASAVELAIADYLDTAGSVVDRLILINGCLAYGGGHDR
jgi:hypothetical protein